MNTVSNINSNNTRTYRIDIISCNHTNIKHLNHHHGHIITEDLQTIENRKLRNIISRRPNYMEPKTINWTKSKESIMEGLDNLIKGKLFSAKKISEESLIPWKSVSLTKIDQKKSKLNTRIKSFKSNPIMK